MCGVIGIYGSGNAAYDLYDAMIVLQHRGQDACGIITYDGNQFHLHKDLGLTRDVFTPDVMERLKGPIGIAHLRYPTVGGGGVLDAQPFQRSSPYGIAMAHNGNLVNFWQLKKDLAEKELVSVNSNCDVEIIMHVFAQALLRQNPGTELKPEAVFAAVQEVYEKVSGGYFVVAHIAGQGMVAFRDPRGLRPGIFGKRDVGLNTDYIFASESVAFELLGCKRVSDVGNGEVIFIDKDKTVHRKTVAHEKFSPCIFEHVYFARPDSIMDGISVYKSRLHMGKLLAKKVKAANLDIDVVSPVPDTSRSTATALAHEIGVKMREGLIKNRYIGRTFIMAGQEIRQKSIKYKLTPNVPELEGKNVLLVDDSIVRGNTSKKIIAMVREAGAKKVYFASAAPPLRYPCLYGIDLPSRKEYIANELSIDEIAKSIGADALFYQDLDDLVEAVSFGDVNNFCLACFDGKYPTGDVDDATLGATEKERDAERGGSSYMADQAPLL
ncbi:amidophosphoribosyltransferase [Candidatus Peregrinibacteria bacterium CG22_combo_CG10-13_8_21_14_all_44_10]|nr:MAG: amidophosphoribosyltransferase [Candidatus Peregrinibacteria bacterium CG2_30_44_17]PIP66634.1 MAG: amidophosphoribosyltransferase [Candidatus Peregrinibacteria bacterium CG22_combo_CG10-13_8_21_14_all_44_10]PIS03784.1 MAG: amidophosphoribosyltransferase [Candidatus Peregrinibacteria bacterium CG10_big_fil_rev_8_21_14_0_10_44_7]PIX79939.1 MAG: amidophosphoribosyltransferase [Candidatus Peregrinibacteria bacterium CG_4_10_14_3_um_filter_44_21]PJB88301.1 MAG: amidophosphoribosyltransferas